MRARPFTPAAVIFVKRVRGVRRPHQNVRTEKEKAMKLEVKKGDQSMPQRMTLSHLRARIRAGAYQDDQYADEERRLLFLRWLVGQGWVNEWQGQPKADRKGRATSA
jgi:hypothetical protein